MTQTDPRTATSAPPELTADGQRLGRDPRRVTPPPEGLEEGVINVRRTPPPPSAQRLPPRTAASVLDVLASRLGMGEECGVNCNEITRWYGLDDAWCAMTVSYALFFGGFNNGSGRIDVPGIVTTTSKGWAVVSDIVDDFSRAGRWDESPRAGDIFTVRNQYHTGLVWEVSGNQIWTLEGNWGDALVSVERSVAECDGFAHPPYGSNGNYPPEWPGRYLQLEDPYMEGPDVRTWQRQMAARAWRIDVDGFFGPQTSGVCVAFQQEQRLEADGIVGPVTWNAAWRPLR